jgi:hypothetical protein
MRTGSEVVYLRISVVVIKPVSLKFEKRRVLAKLLR